MKKLIDATLFEDVGSQVTAALLTAHNEARAKARRKPLRLNEQLQAAALSHAQDMAAMGQLTHDGSDGSRFWQRILRAGYSFNRATENAAAGQATPAATVKAWLAEGQHRANLLGPYRDVGLAGVQDGQGRWWWCADYGTLL